MNVPRCFVAMGFLTIVPALSAVMLTAAPPAQYAPPPVVKPSAELLKKIEERQDKLNRVLRQFRQMGVKDPVLSDIEIYSKAATWIVRHNEFYQKNAAEWTVEALERGLFRASQQAQGEMPWFFQTGATVVHAYRSHVDDSIQPYAVTLPAEYGKERKKWRIEVVLHGRNNGLTEVSFLHTHNGEKPAPADLDHIRLDIYGRGNVAYRWAGESDVTEAVEHFLAVEQRLHRGDFLDLNRGVLRGFSMGGAGTWHLGLHAPDHWCVISPGAGFTTTHGYVKNLPEKLPPEQEACLHIYDAVDYAENAFDVPVVSYGGSKDPQLQASRNIEARLKELNIPMKLLVAPGLGHQFPPEWQKKMADARSEYTAKGRNEYPPRVRFVTYTLRYPGCHWVQIEGLEQHYQRASVDAERTEDGFKVKTSNVRILHLLLWPGASRQAVAVQIDGQRIEAQPYAPVSTSATLSVYLERRGGRWYAVLPEKVITDRSRRLQKSPGLQGPIDDAFLAPFLCVRGTGTAWHEATDNYARANLERFRKEWSKYLRGELLVKDDVEVTPQDLASRHLILFGDPSSNSLIAQVMPGLPFTWSKDKITWQGKEYAAGEHVPALIYPSPLSTLHYVVLNSGHTFHADDFQGTNALLYPRLGDYAILRLASAGKDDKKDPLAVEVQKAGLFDDYWKAALPPK
jgi:pimeloyl-ACP methyl ester carboxylesterase